MIQNISKKDVVITGEWDGQPIWRKKTSSEKLVDEISEHDCHFSPEDGCAVCAKYQNE